MNSRGPNQLRAIQRTGRSRRRRMSSRRNDKCEIRIGQMFAEGHSFFCAADELRANEVGNLVKDHD